MFGIFRKPYRWAILYTAILIIFMTGSLLDTFVIARAEIAVTKPASSGTITTTGSTTAATQTGTQAGTQIETQAETQAETEAGTQVDGATITSTSYEDENIKITIQTVHEYDTWFYVADVAIKDVSYLKTALAHDLYGRNIKETTSAMASDNNAIFAINGDYYGFRSAGFVLRNGVLYRSAGRTGSSDEALVISQAGDFSIVHESDADAARLAAEGAWQIFSFGPALVENGQITVSASSEVGQAQNSNPRTAIGQISALHYIFIVSDGRSSVSQGLSLLELASEFQERGCQVAYNLDGGGSSTMWFDGQVVNNPTDGRTDSERQVSDIVYIGYS
jgi:exopolysaccharide biosynthesis protein